MKRYLLAALIMLLTACLSPSEDSPQTVEPTATPVDTLSELNVLNVVGPQLLNSNLPIQDSSLQGSYDKFLETNERFSGFPAFQSDLNPNIVVIDTPNGYRYVDFTTYKSGTFVDPDEAGTMVWNFSDLGFSELTPNEGQVFEVPVHNNLSDFSESLSTDFTTIDFDEELTVGSDLYNVVMNLLDTGVIDQNGDHQGVFNNVQVYPLGHEYIDLDGDGIEDALAMKANVNGEDVFIVVHRDGEGQLVVSVLNSLEVESEPAITEDMLKNMTDEDKVKLAPNPEGYDAFVSTTYGNLVILYSQDGESYAHDLLTGERLSLKDANIRVFPNVDGTGYVDIPSFAYGEYKTGIRELFVKYPPYPSNDPLKLQRVGDENNLIEGQLRVFLKKIGLKSSNKPDSMGMIYYGSNLVYYFTLTDELSNGKIILWYIHEDENGEIVIIWSEVGTNGMSGREFRESVENRNIYKP